MPLTPGLICVACCMHLGTAQKALMVPKGQCTLRSIRRLSCERAPELWPVPVGIVSTVNPEWAEAVGYIWQCHTLRHLGGCLGKNRTQHSTDSHTQECMNKDGSHGSHLSELA